ncbi:MAG TPA: ferrochelatase [Rhizomicrobium sp.]|nr:ferrochelatase [Rhizomicrobium sp.]
MKLAVVLFNLGGPDSPEAVEPFLQNLFTDPAIIRFPGFVRRPLGRWIAARRASTARNIYAKIGGRSPILEETEAQARALETALARPGTEARAFVAMRHWRPFSYTAAEAVAAWKPDKLVLLPLYPQYSTTTTASSFEDWNTAARQEGLAKPDTVICCYPKEEGFIAAEKTLLCAALAKRQDRVDYRVLFSAHGLPKSVIARGDPYQTQVEQTASAVAAVLESCALEWRICYQSRVGPLAWIEPATDAEIRRAGQEGKGVIVVPVSFVSEHSETLVELDSEYAKLARESGAPDYIRVPTVRTQDQFIGGLARLVWQALSEQTDRRERPAYCTNFRYCAFGGGRR